MFKKVGDKMHEKLLLLPNKPGCYLMKNKDNIIIYVGKAKNLKNRVNSYFRGKHTGKTAKLVSEIVDFEYIVVGSELESLILEINLIKKYDPKYNILLRDDKSYPYIELTDDSVPRLNVVRNINKKKNQKHLYGPYPNVTAARNVVNLLNRIYPLRKCTTYSKKPCLYYHIKQCLGYCTYNIPKDTIDNMKSEIIRFLKGDDSILVKKIKEEMDKESSLLHFEKAKELKDMLESISYVLTRQKVELSDNIDRDIFGYYVDRGYLSIQVFFIRNSKIIERHSKIVPIIEDEINELTRYIAEFYNKGILKPKEILVPDNLDLNLLESYLEIKVKTAIKGEKLKIINMARENAKIALNEQFDLIQRDEAKTVLANNELKE